MSGIAVHTEGLGKAYRIGENREKGETLLGSAFDTLSAPVRNLMHLRSLDTFRSEANERQLLWALKDIDLTIHQGERLGFVGPNGAGKSTLLKILSRVTRPTRGRVGVAGRVSSLLEVGTGFHPELTGRDNIFMNGTILGMGAQEIRRKFDEIVEFSGVEKFIDTPIKRYSSGMKVRLGFAVASTLEPDILIIDEVLAVGDAEFQRKCLGRMQEVGESGRTVLFVSHNLGSVQSLCSRVVLLERGHMTASGPPEEMVRRYLSGMEAIGASGFSDDNPLRKTRGQIRLTRGRVLDRHGQEMESPISGEAIGFEFNIANEGRPERIKLRLTFKNADGRNIFVIYSGLDGVPIAIDRNLTVRVHLPVLPLRPGDYTVGTELVVADGDEGDRIPNAFEFSVPSSTFFPGGRVPNRQQGDILMSANWEAVEMTPAHEEVRSLSPSQKEA